MLPVARQLQSVAAANGWASGRPAMSAQADASLATPASTSVEAARPAPSRRRSMGSPPPLSQPSGTPPSGVVPRRVPVLVPHAGPLQRAAAQCHQQRRARRGHVEELAAGELTGKQL